MNYVITFCLDDGWSEDSSGIFGSPGKTGEGKEGENGDDADIGTRWDILCSSLASSLDSIRHLKNTF